MKRRGIAHYSNVPERQQLCMFEPVVIRSFNLAITVAAKQHAPARYPGADGKTYSCEPGIASAAITSRCGDVRTAGEKAYRQGVDVVTVMGEQFRQWTLTCYRR